MSIYQKITELQKAFADEFGVTVRVDVWAHDLTNDLPDEKAVTIQTAIAGESESLKPSTVLVEKGNFTNYKVQGKNFELHLTVNQPIMGGVENERIAVGQH